MTVRLSKMRVFSFDRYIFCMTFLTGFTHRNLHGFVRFPGYSTVLVRPVWFSVEVVLYDPSTDES